MTVVLSFGLAFCLFLSGLCISISQVNPPVHEYTSPSNGTDLSKPIPLIKCSNQSSCVTPYLQLQRAYNVYFCKHVVRAGVRFYYLVREGLLRHPMINLVEDPYKADAVVWLPESARWHKTECNASALKHKTIVLDEGDGPQLFDDNRGLKVKWLLYYKRSFVRRQNGAFRGYMPYLHHKGEVLPMTYTIMDAYIRHTFPTMKERVMEIVSTLRATTSDPTRSRVVNWIKDYCDSRNVQKCVAGSVNSGNRPRISAKYMHQMYGARIIVTSNPSAWEGDFRLMEAISSGALIFVDTMFVPRPYHLVQNEHIVYYDSHNQSDLYYKLDLYRQYPEKARRIAIAGYLHALKYHRAVNLIDYVFRTLHLKDSKGHGIHPPYTATGFHMRNRCLRFQERYAEMTGGVVTKGGKGNKGKGNKHHHKDMKKH